MDEALVRESRRLLHDVNAALQLVIGNLELMDLSGPHDAEHKEMIDGALGGAADATRLVQELQQRIRSAGAAPGATDS
jgi:hypothetical protein